MVNSHPLFKTKYFIENWMNVLTYTEIIPHSYIFFKVDILRVYITKIFSMLLFLPQVGEGKERKC